MSTDLTSTTTAHLTGPQKAAILLLRLGTEQAAPLLRTLQRTEVSAIMAELAQLGTIDPALADAVVEEFLGMAITGGGKPLPVGDLRSARTLLAESLGERAAYEVLRELDGSASDVPFQFLQGLEPATVADNLKDEHPQTIALVLTHLTIDTAAAVLVCLPEDVLTEVGIRVGTLDRVTTATLTAVERALRKRMAPILQATYAPGTGGVGTLVELLTKAGKDTERVISTALAAHDPDLAREVKSRMFTFEDLVLLDDRQMQLVLRNVDAARLPLALKGVREEVRDRFFANLSSRARDNLAEEMELLGQVRLADVRGAQGEVLEAVRNLEASGELIINRGGADYVS